MSPHPTRWRVLLAGLAVLGWAACAPAHETSAEASGDGGGLPAAGGSPGTGGVGVPACARAPVDLPEAADLPVVADLPDPFLFADGTRVHAPADWACRREEIKAQAQRYEYGALPPPATSVTGSLIAGTLTVNVQANGKQASFTAAVTLPAGTGPFPAFVHLSSGAPAAPAASFTARGYAFVFLNAAAVAADAATRSGVFYTLYPEADAGVLMAWAWGVQRVVDVLGSVSQIDSTMLAVNGFSRWGKAALLAGAFDDRIAVTIPSCSGFGGSGQLRFFYEDPSDPSTDAEQIADAWTGFPYWYAARLGDFVGGVTRLPFDQHAIMALVAPRALIVTQGEFDYWTNPRGTAIAWRAARTVFDFLGVPANLGGSWDDVGHALTQKHIDDMLDFADVHVKGAASMRDFLAVPADLADDPTTHPWTAPVP
jgi:Glucuronyl esterase, fungi